MYWSEADARGIDAALVMRLDPMRVAMRVDDAINLRCVALTGVVGEDTRCLIYANRPTPCRELQAAWEDGEPSPQCDRARARHALRPLTLQDWRSSENPEPTLGA
jgi:Fe-S-cluster containining protein